MVGFSPTPLALVYVFAALIIVLLAVYILLNDRTSLTHPTTRTLVYVLVAASCWSGPYTLHLLTDTLHWKLFWFNLSHLGASLVVPAFLLHIAAIAGYYNWFTKPKLAFLALEPSITAVLVATEPFHDLLRTDVSLIAIGATTVMHRGIGPWWFIRSPYLYLLIGTVFLVGAIAYLRSSWLIRRQLLVAGIGIGVAVGVNIIFDLQFLGTPPAPEVFLQVELTSVALAVTAMTLTASVLHYRYLDLAFVGRRVAIDHLRDAYVVVDDDHRIIDHNPRFREIVGATSRMYGIRIDECIPEIGSLSRSDTQMTTELSIEGHGWYEVHRVPIVSTKDSLLSDPSADHETRDAVDASGHVLVFRDVTDRKRRERRLETRNDQLAVLNQIVNHDIHNEMDLALALTRRVRQDLDGDGKDEHQAEAIDYLDQVVQSSNRVVELTDTARGIVEAIEESEEDLQPIALKPVLEREYLHATAYEGARIEVDDEIPDVDVLANDMLASIFRNLIRNAVIHNDKETPEIIISTESSTDDVTIEIADNGPGISRARRETLLASDGSAANTSGSGVGLTLVRTLVDQYEGVMSIDDRSGGGTSITITLRLAESA